MKTLRIEITGVDDSDVADYISSINSVMSRKSSPNKTCDISFSYKEDDSDPIPVTESTPFSRYLSSTTPEGRTK